MHWCIHRMLVLSHAVCWRVSFAHGVLPRKVSEGLFKLIATHAKCAIGWTNLETCRLAGKARGKGLFSIRLRCFSRWGCSWRLWTLLFVCGFLSMLHMMVARFSDVAFLVYVYIAQPNFLRLQDQRFHWIPALLTLQESSYSCPYIMFSVTQLHFSCELLRPGFIQSYCWSRGTRPADMQLAFVLRHPMISDRYIVK